MLRRCGVETVILAGADAHGIMRGKRLPIAELDRAAERGIALCDVVWALPVDERPSVYGIVAASRNEPFAGAVRETLLRYGLAVEACNPEAGPGQFEINLRAAPALQAADEAFLLKSAVKEVAADQGLLATSWPSRVRTGPAARATSTSACAKERRRPCATSSAGCWKGRPS